MLRDVLAPMKPSPYSRARMSAIRPRIAASSHHQGLQREGLVGGSVSGPSFLLGKLAG